MRTFPTHGCGPDIMVPGNAHWLPSSLTRLLPWCGASYMLTSIRYRCFFSWRNIRRSPWLSYGKCLMVASFDIKYDQKTTSRCSWKRKPPRIGLSSPHSSYTILSLLNIATRFFLYKSIDECMSRPPRSTVVESSAGSRKTTLYAFGQPWDSQIQLL